MDTQTIINTLFGLFGAAAGWTLNRLWQSMDNLQRRDDHLADKVQAIELLVTGTYVKRQDVEKMTDAIFTKLDRIEAKLDRKVDKT